MKRALALALLFGSPVLALAQAPAAPPKDVAVAPIECWWKTDRSAIRVGEQFELTLTCAVLDTDAVKVVVDESSLAPSALHLVPFEIVNGQRFRDILNSPRRFFQYQYTMRVLGEDFFGKEVPLPRLQLSYRVQNALNGGSALSGREEQYSLRPVPIRVLSVVPKDAADIRDAPPDTFGDVDRRLFRSNVLIMVAGVALGLAVLLVVVALVRATVKRRTRTAARKLVVSPGTVLRAASRGALGRARRESAGRLERRACGTRGRGAAAGRRGGVVRPVGQRPVGRDVKATEGQIAIARADCAAERSWCRPRSRRAPRSTETAHQPPCYGTASVKPSRSSAPSVQPQRRARRHGAGCRARGRTGPRQTAAPLQTGALRQISVCLG